jgi:Fuc2NAc and GlcNAc transferase
MSVTSLYISSFILGFVGAWIIGHFGIRLGLIDFPNERSSHIAPTPKGGGVGIFAAFLLSSIHIGLPITLWLPISGLSILALLEDKVDLSPKFRLCAQLCLMACLIIGVGHLPSSSLLYLILALFWTVFIVGAANFYNFMDGINGIAGITGLIGFGLLAVYVHINKVQIVLFPLAVSTSLACLGFLPLNMPKAKVFMGDIGSMLLGSGFGCFVYLASDTLLDFICMASFLLPFYVDELTTMFVRLKNGERLTQAHRSHIYQLLANEKGIPHWQVSLGFGLLQLIVGLNILLAKSYGMIAVLFTLGFYFVALSVTTFYIRAYLGRALHLKKFP